MKIWTSCVQQGSSNFVHKVEKHIKKYQLFPFPNNTGKEVALIDRSPAGTVVKTSVSHARGLRFKSRYGQFFFRILPLPIFSQDFFIYFNLYHLRFFMLLTLNSGTEKYWISIYVLTLLSKNPDQPNPLGTFSGCHTHMQFWYWTTYFTENIFYNEEDKHSKPNAVSKLYFIFSLV